MTVSMLIPAHVREQDGALHIYAGRSAADGGRRVGTITGTDDGALELRLDGESYTGKFEQVIDTLRDRGWSLDDGSVLTVVALEEASVAVAELSGKLTAAQETVIAKIRADMRENGLPDRLVTQPLARELVSYGNPEFTRSNVRLLVQYPRSVIVFRDPDVEWPVNVEYVVPDSGLILAADGQDVTAEIGPS